MTKILISIILIVGAIMCLLGVVLVYKFSCYGWAMYAITTGTLTILLGIYMASNIRYLK